MNVRKIFELLLDAIVVALCYLVFATFVASTARAALLPENHGASITNENSVAPSHLTKM